MEINPFLFLFDFSIRLNLKLIFGFLFYVYFSRTLQLIGQKLNYKKHRVAWIPFVHLFLLPIYAKKKWYFGFVMFFPIIYFFIRYIYGFIFDYLLFFLELIYLLFVIYWTWIIFEKLKFPGYLSLIMIISLIPIIGIFSTIIYYFLLGIVAIFDRDV